MLTLKLSDKACFLCGVTEDTAVQCVEAGANVLVAGSAVFGADDPAKAAARIRAAAERAAAARADTGR